MKGRLILLLLVLLCGVGGVKAQNVEYIAELDTNYIMIGDQIHFRMKVLAEPGARVNFPVLKDTLAKGIEIVSGPVRDSVEERDGRMLIEESYVITSFDTGVYVLPSVPIQVLREDFNNVLRTDPIQLIVNTYVVDLQKGYNDIVMPKSAPWTFGEILPYVLWVLLGLAVVALIVWIVKQEKLWQSGKTKEYYTRLTDAIRTYLNGELGISAMEQTSFETLRDLEKNKNVTKEQREKLAMMFETADFVKFAKAEPLPNENESNLNIAYGFVNETNETIREQEEKARQEAEAKERAMREQEEKEARAGQEAEQAPKEK